MPSCRVLSPDDQIYLFDALGPALPRIVSKATALRDVLATLAEERVEVGLLETLGGDGLRSLIVSAEQLAEVLEWVYGQCDRLVLDLLGADHLRHLCLGGYELSLVLHGLDHARQRELLDTLGWEHVLGVVQDRRDLAYLVRALPAELSRRAAEPPDRGAAALPGPRRGRLALPLSLSWRPPRPSTWPGVAGGDRPCLMKRSQPGYGSPGSKGSLAPLRGSKYPLVDAHLHVVNFVQQTPGGPALIEAMDRANVRKAVIFGLPVAKMWAECDREAPDYYLADDARCYYYRYTDVHRGRDGPLPARRAAAAALPADVRLQPHRQVLPCATWSGSTRQYPDVWCGIGELLLRHDDLTAFTYGEVARANHRALWPIYEFAADHDLPVLIHHNITSVSKSDHPTYLYEFEEALRDFPRTRFILAHCGMSRRVNVPFYHQMVQRLLDQYPQLVVDYSWIIFDVAICPNGRPQEEWLALTEQYSHRICLGSDLVTALRAPGPRAAALRRLPGPAQRRGAGQHLLEHAGAGVRAEQATRGHGSADARRLTQMRGQRVRIHRFHRFRRFGDEAGMADPCRGRHEK